MKDLLMNAMHEIQGLRRRNEVLEAKAETLDIFAAALGMKRNAGGMAPDVAWQLQKKISELDTQEKSQ